MPGPKPSTRIADVPDAELPSGTYRTPNGGCRIFRRDPSGRQIPRRFKPDEPLRAVLEWIEEVRVLGRLEARGVVLPPTDAATGFRARARAYLASVTSMPSYTDQARYIHEWIAVFGDQDPATITALHIRTALEKQRKTHAAESCNHRRTALMAFYTSLNGKSGYNPVRDVDKYDTEEETRSQSIWTCYRILALMRPSRTRARLRVLLTTGWPHKQIGKYVPKFLDTRNPDRPRVWVTPRRKGKKKGKARAGRWVRVLPGAVTALRDLPRWDALGPFSRHSVYKSFKLALGKLNAQRAAFDVAHQRPVREAIIMRPYDLRHSFGTWLADQDVPERTIMELMLHSRIEQTYRYTRGAAQGVTDRAVDRLVGNRAKTPPLVTSVLPSPKKLQKSA
jgi:integrase